MKPRQSLEKCSHGSRWVNKSLLCKSGGPNLGLRTRIGRERTDSIKQFSDLHICITAHESIYASYIHMMVMMMMMIKVMAMTQGCLRPQELKDAERGWGWGVQYFSHGSHWRSRVVTLASNNKPLVLEARLWYFAEWLSETCTRHGREAGCFSSLWCSLSEKTGVGIWC